MPRLSDKVCLITGAAQGIGLATAERFAQEGALVVLTDVKPQAVATGGVADELAASIRDPAALRRLIVMREILDRPVHRWE